ncbi:MAG: hypothetical protein ACLQIS_00850 [Bryobacteraceae bacterium]
MDDDTIAEIVRRGIVYVPTIEHNRYYADNFQLLRYPPEAVERLNAFIWRNLETARKAFAAGVTFVMAPTPFTPCSERTRASQAGS